MIMKKINAKEVFMSKNKKTALMVCSIFLMATLLFGAFMPAFAVGEPDDQQTLSQEVLLRLTLKTIDRTLLKESDMNSYSWLLFVDLIDCFPRGLTLGENGANTEVLYPNEYAGAFIDADNRLHIILTKPVDGETEYDYRAITSYDETVIFDIAQYPLTFLCAVQRTLDDIMSDFGIQLTCLNERINRLEVHLFDRTTEQDVVAFLKTKFNDFDEKCLLFKDAAGEIRPTAANTSTNALSGANVTDDNRVWIGTLGFNAKRTSDGVYGVVTADHVSSNGNTIKNELGGTIGTTANGQYQGNIDASFTPFKKNLLGIGDVKQSYQLYGTYSANKDFLTGYFPNDYYLAGRSVNKIGCNTSLTTGTISNLKSTFSVSGVTFTNQIEVSNKQWPGDSGGPVYHTLALPSNQIDLNILIGIATFGNANSPYQGWASSVWNIANTLGVEPYTYDLQYRSVDSIYNKANFSPGTVTNENGLKGIVPDGDFAKIQGTSTTGSGGQIVAKMSTATTKTRDIWVYAYSATGYTTQLHVYATTDPNTLSSWVEVTSGTLLVNSGAVTWVYCGRYSSAFDYIGVTAITEGGRTANINIDSVIAVSV